MKSIVAMICITALGIVQLVMYGDGGVLTGAITAISALAGVEVGSRIAKKE